MNYLTTGNSMSASILHHIHGVNGVKYKSTQFIDGLMIISADLLQANEICPSCKSSHLQYKDKSEKRLQMCPTGDKACWLYLTMSKRKCMTCLDKWWPKPSFASGQRRMVRSFERYIIRMTSFMTISNVASELGLSWNTVKDIHKEYLRRIYSKPYNFKQLEYLGIDEFSIGKNHDYMTIFINLDTAQIIHAVEGRSREAIIPFIKKLTKKATNLKAVAMDMSGPYQSAMNEFFPFLDIVFDRFHIIKLMNEAIDQIRREQQYLYKEAGHDVLKGGRYLLLKNLEKLSPLQSTNLQLLLEMNAPLAVAHQMKEQLRQFWNQTSRQNAAKFLLGWIWCTSDTKVPILFRVGRTLLRHSDGLLNYYNHLITNATTEGVNNKIETLKRQAYGYRDMEYFKLRLYHLHAQKTELIG